MPSVRTAAKGERVDAVKKIEEELDELHLATNYIGAQQKGTLPLLPTIPLTGTLLENMRRETVSFFKWGSLERERSVFNYKALVASSKTHFVPAAKF